MGLIKLSQKVKRSPVVGVRYWSDRGMFDFIPAVAYDVPVEGGAPTAHALERLHEDIYDAETAADPFGSNMIGVHIEVHDQGYLTITIGSFAT